MAKTLFVPIGVEAMVVNNKTADSPYNLYRRPTLDYNGLKKGANLIKKASQTFIRESLGIYVKWNLIEALKNGEEAEDGFNFPLIPNRWLVVRYDNKKGQISKSWIVQSDYLGSKGTNSFIDPYKKEFTPTKIGKKVDIKNWSEKKEDKDGFLTAMGAGGDIMFSVFQPFNENILSIKDEWNDIKNFKELSYFVAGWHSNTKDDFLKKEILSKINKQKKGNDNVSNEELDEYIKEELGLALKNDELEEFDFSIYFGAVTNIPINEDNYKSDKPNRDNISIAIGNTDTDILGAIIKDPKKKYLLELFNEHMLDKFDEANNRYAIDQELHKTWFDSNKSDKLYVSKEIDNEKLKGINKKQKELNIFEKKLSYQLKELIRIIYTREKYDPSIRYMPTRKINDLELGYDKDKLNINLKGIRENIEYLVNQISSLNDELAKDISEKKCEKIALGNYYMPKDPTLMFMGLKSKKYDDSLVQAFIADTHKNTIFKKLPDGIDFIYKNFLGYFDKNFKDKHSFKKWSQPWNPLYIDWSIRYIPIDFEKSWMFDSNCYKYINSVRSNNKNSVVIDGKNIISANNTYSLKKLLEDFKDKYNDLSLDNIKTIDQLILKISDWDHLSQKLDGLNLTIRQETQELGLPLDGKLLKCLGEELYSQTKNLLSSNDENRPLLGLIDDDGIRQFSDFRSGIFTINSLCVVDTFGQSLVVITDTQESDKEYIISKDLSIRGEQLRDVILPPRLLQTCRLKFDLLYRYNKNDEDIIVDENSSENPIFAWVLPNHFDKSIDFYDNQGGFLGKVSIFARKEGEKETLYQGKKIENIYLKKFLNSPILTKLENYEKFFKTIDRTLWNIDPLGDREDASLSVLIGRPLALFRAKLEYELEDEPIVYRGWKYAIESKKPQFINYNLPILLGSNELRADGLVGFFEEENYDQFNCVHLPDNEKDDLFIKEINPKNLLDLKIGEIDENNKLIPDKKHITMLVDPRGKVHATTHILPVKKLSIPNRFIDSIKSVDINFRIDSLLTNIIKDDTLIDKITMPIPAQNSGEWSFKSSIKEAKEVLELLSSNNDLANNNTDTTIKSGYLNLTIKDKNEQNFSKENK